MSFQEATLLIYSKFCIELDRCNDLSPIHLLISLGEHNFKQFAVSGVINNLLSVIITMQLNTFEPFFTETILVNTRTCLILPSTN